MRFPLVLTIFRKEFIEAMRDRRTLFLMVGIPILLYPLLIMGMSRLQENQEAAQTARSSKLAVWGAVPPELAARLKASPRLEIVEWGSTPANIRTGLEQGKFPAPPPAALRLDADDDQKPSGPKDPDNEVTRAARAAILDRKVDGVLVLWPGFTDAVTAGRLGVASVLFDSVRLESRKARDRASDALRQYRVDLLAQREKAKNLDSGFATGVDVQSQNIAPESRKTGQFLGMLLPYLLITFSLMSGFYAAIDMTAGEKERGTMQTLLCAPVEALEIITGKFLAVWSISMIATSVNLLSLSLTFSRMRLMPGATMSVSVENLAVAFLMLIPVTLMVNALFLAIGAFAKDFKEGQSYLTPVLMGLIMPLVVTTMPGIELNRFLAFAPIVNIALFIRSVFVGEWSADYLFLVLLSSFCYASLALVFAARVFEMNNLLLGGKEGAGSLLDFSRRPGARPTPGVSFFLFAIVLVLVFYASAGLEKRGLPTILLVTQYGFFLAPALALAYWKGYSLKDTFSLRMPSFSAIVGGILVGLSGWAAAGLLLRLLPPPESLVKAMEKLVQIDDKTPLWMAIALIAVTPAICEEFLFRGAILSGFRRMGMWPALGMTALLFGLAHASIYRLLPTAFLGLLFGYAVWKSGSILPSILAHGVNNGLIATLAKSPDWVQSLGLQGMKETPWSWIAAGCAVLAVGVWLISRSAPPPDLPSPPESFQGHSLPSGY